MILGIYFALNSGTVDSVVYDVVLEETGSSDDYELWIGRVQMVQSGAFVVSALAGGVLAGWTSARLTYFASIPFIAVAIIAFLRFDEPRLHRRTGACRAAPARRADVPHDDAPARHPAGDPARRAGRTALPGDLRVRAAVARRARRARRPVRPLLGRARLHSRRRRIPHQQAQLQPPRPDRADRACRPSGRARPVPDPLARRRDRGRRRCSRCCWRSSRSMPASSCTTACPPISGLGSPPESAPSPGCCSCPSRSSSERSPAATACTQRAG